MDKQIILNIPFDTLNENQVIDFILDSLGKDQKLFIATPNPEILLESQKNHHLRDILNQTDLNTPDGTGIIWANNFLEKNKGRSNRIVIILSAILELLKVPFYRLSKSKFQKTVTGTNLMQSICLDKRFNKYKIFLLGGEEGVAEATKIALQKQNPNINIVGFYSGSYQDIKCVKKVDESQAEILFVAFGCPKQEFWINENRHLIKHLKLAIGIGGAFDFISNKVKRAPSILQKIGLEWLFRLLHQPLKRYKRIVNAIIKFPITIVKERIKKNN